MRAAVISLTEKGRSLSRRIADLTAFTDTERYCFYRHSDDDAQDFTRLNEIVPLLFHDVDVIIFVSACGIAVRSIAPYLCSKITDPAVIVIDDCGKFVIPILSGHIGGANAIAEKIADFINAQAVITTATDTGGHFSPDSFAAANGLLITDMNAAKEVASAVLDGENTGFASPYEYINMPNDVTADTDCRTGIYVGNDDIKPFPVTLRLVPKNIVIGVGCKRGTDCAVIENAVMTALADNGIAFERICGAATIDLKADEKGIVGFCCKHGLEMSVYSAKELMETVGDFTSSDFVKSITGTDNVCERSAVRCSGGKLVMHKTAAEGVTVAAAEKPILLDFERKML